MKRRAFDVAFTAIAAIAAAGAVTLFVAILAVVLYRGFGVLSWSFLTEDTRAAGAAGGIVYQITGTAILVLTAAVTAVPLAAGAGIWQAMYAGSAARRTFESVLHAINGVPSVVFGLIG
ncbi:MAG TPA: hypothetical protein VM733_15665, partial [Thermoanaerobaculia bacterium]|nr:hypothetical protein [Thermoanaerobaculia bacterium]